MDEANLPKPTFKKQDFMTIATIRNNFIEDNVPKYVPKNVPINVPKKVTKKTSDGQCLDIIIAAIIDNPNITRDELAAIIGKSIKTVQRIISSSGIIKHVGPLKSGHWEIVSNELKK